MKWTKEHDKELVKEMLMERPFEQPKGSPMIGLIWQKIVDNLNAKEYQKFCLKGIRSVRERYGILEEKHKRKMREELNESGISPEPDELDQLLEEIIALFNSHDEIREKDKETKNDEKNIAEDIRFKALETFGETKRRKSETTSDSESEQGENCQTRKTDNRKKRKSQTLEYFRSKHDSELEFNKQELEVRKQELELRRQELEAHSSQNEGLMKVLLEFTKK